MNDTQVQVSTSKAQLWGERVEQWRQSGLSMRAYCRQERISFNGLRYWKAKEPQPAESRRAVKLSIAAPAVSCGRVIEVVVAERFRVRVPEGFQSGELERVVRSLESV